jgi:predicted hydrocarbon binding protein
MEPRSKREVAIPAATLLGLQRALRIESGPVVAVQAMNAAGYHTGEALGEEVLGTAGDAEDTMASATFWRTLREQLRARGWGTLEHEAIHPAVGLLASRDWAEAEGDGEVRPACAFSSGLLAAILSHAAGGSVAVLETECRARGDERCAFVFGSEQAVRALHAELLEGADLDDALSAL